MKMDNICVVVVQIEVGLVIQWICCWLMLSSHFFSHQIDRSIDLWVLLAQEQNNWETAISIEIYLDPTAVYASFVSNEF